MRSHRTRTSHSLVPSMDYFTTRLKKYAYNKKFYTDTDLGRASSVESPEDAQHVSTVD